MDLAVVWRSRRWRRLLNLIDGLPRNSHVRHAQAHDADVAEAQATLPVPDPVDYTVPFTEWSPETELLTLLVELLGEHLALTSAINSKDQKVHHPKPLPRPWRAIDAVLARKVDDAYDDLLADIARAQEAG